MLAREPPPGVSLEEWLTIIRKGYLESFSEECLNGIMDRPGGRIINGKLFLWPYLLVLHDLKCPACGKQFSRLEEATEHLGSEHVRVVEA